MASQGSQIFDTQVLLGMGKIHDKLMGIGVGHLTSLKQCDIRRGGEEGVGKGVEDGGKHKERGLVNDPPPQSTTCAVGGPLPRPAGKEHGSCPGTVASPRHPNPPPVGVGGNGWRCP